MTISEIAQVIFYFVASATFLIFIVFILTIGITIVRLLVSLREGIESVKKESVAIKERIQKTLNEVSLVNLVSKISGWFSKKRSDKKS